ncbi:MAG: DNA repair protein RadC [Clostridia bacterium]|nr:DNA repair protein RadC [Clostridia bacterium]
MDNLHAGHRKRQRDQYLATGVAGMPDHALLELLLSFAIPRRDVNPLAHRLINKFGSLENVLSATKEELLTVDGVGEHTIVLLQLLFDLHKRLELQPSFPKKRTFTLNNSEQACRYGLALSARDRYETVRLICLDAKLHVLNTCVLSVGTKNSVFMDPRHVFEKAFFYQASGIILMHNHPSGNVCPSEDDVETAERILALADELRVNVRDQIILGEKLAYSFAFDKVFSFPSASKTITYPLNEYRAMLERIEQEERHTRIPEMIS